VDPGSAAHHAASAARCAASGARTKPYSHSGEINMTTSDNRKLVEHIFSETADGNWQPLLESLTDDFRFIVTGSSKWARSYDGKAAVLT
jgi:hypothetical protein